MARKTSRRRVGREKAPGYAGVGNDFFRGAALAMQHECWNAAGLLFVHAAIAFADAVAIQLGGMKSTSDDHLDAIALLREVAAGTADRDEALQHLRRLIDEKNRVAYSGVPFRRRDVESMAKHAERFQGWTKRLLGS